MQNTFDLKEILDKYIVNDSQMSRERSFDYCYNYFRQHDSDFIINNMELSCLTLGFYLASWGMLRGSSFLLQKNAKYYEQTIEYIADSKQDKILWEIDVDSYSNENIHKIIKRYEDLKDIIIEEKQTHLTLVTKILLGVYGFIPAFDSNFIAGFKTIYNKNGFTVINEKTLRLIGNFYEENKENIESISSMISTIDFKSGQPLFRYPKAKIIDMYGFEKGLKILNNERINFK